MEENDSTDDLPSSSEPSASYDVEQLDTMKMIVSDSGASDSGITTSEENLQVSPIGGTISVDNGNASIARKKSFVDSKRQEMPSSYVEKDSSDADIYNLDDDLHDELIAGFTSPTLQAVNPSEQVLLVKSSIPTATPLTVEQQAHRKHIEAIVDEAESVALKAKSAEKAEVVAQRMEAIKRLESKKKRGGSGSRAINSSNSNSAKNTGRAGVDDNESSLFDVDFNESNAQISSIDRFSDNNNKSNSEGSAVLRPTPPLTDNISGSGNGSDNNNGNSYRPSIPVRKKVVRIKPPPTTSQSSGDNYLASEQLEDGSAVNNKAVVVMDGVLPDISTSVKKVAVRGSSGPNIPTGSGSDCVGEMHLRSADDSNTYSQHDSDHKRVHKTKLPVIRAHPNSVEPAHDDEDEVVGSPSKREREERDPNKKRRPLYLRMIAKANKKIFEEEQKRFEAYKEEKQSRAKNNPSRAEIRAHMRHHDELMKCKQEVSKAAIASAIKPFKKAVSSVGKQSLPPIDIATHKKSQHSDIIDGDDSIDHANSSDVAISTSSSPEKRTVQSHSSPSKLRYNAKHRNNLLAPNDEIKVADDKVPLDPLLQENEERKERLRKRKEVADKQHADQHHHKLSPSKSSSSRAHVNSNHEDSETIKEEDSSSIQVTKLSPRSRRKQYKHNAHSVVSVNDSNIHTGASPLKTNSKVRKQHNQRRNHNSSGLKDLDGNPILSDECDMLSGSVMYSELLLTDNIPALDSAALITYCAPDWLDKLTRVESVVSSVVVGVNNSSELVHKQHDVTTIDTCV